MFEMNTTNNVEQTEITFENFRELVDSQLALVGGGTGAVNLE